MASKEIKRMRGEIACAECRRLKIRCDRTIPCTTCVKRGCAALCPVGTIPPGEGSRFVLAATDHLKQKMSKMEARMHALEDAVAILQASESDNKHPLLTSAFVWDDEGDSLDMNTISESEETIRPKKPIGTLHIDKEGGAARFFGPGGGSESLLLKAKEMESSTKTRMSAPIEELDVSYLPAELTMCFQSFPFPLPQDLSRVTIRSTIEAFLPQKARSIHLCEIYLEHLSWMTRIVSRKQIIVELIPVVYKDTVGSYGPHDLALLLIIAGIGALLDPDLPPYNLEAQHYYKLAQAALTLQHLLVEGSITTIKVLHLMSIYNGMSGKESNMELSYALLNLAGQASSRIGFHVDPALWGFKDKEAYERRVYFYNLLAGVMWQSLVTGRPPSIWTEGIDCQVPSAEDEEAYELGEVPIGFGRWGYKSTRELLIPIVKVVLSKPPPYEDVLELEQKLQNFLPPESGIQPEETRTATSMRTFVRSHYRFLMSLFLHRGYFAEVMLEVPFDPLRSPFRQSFLSAYKGACFVMQDTEEQFARRPTLCGRIWMIWSFAFSAAMVIGTVATRAAHVTGLDPPPFQQFKKACSLFQASAETSSRAARALPILMAMLEKASRAQEQRSDHSHLHSAFNSNGDAHDKEVLSLFGGLTNLVSSSSSTPGDVSPSSAAQSSVHHFPPTPSYLSLPDNLPTEAVRMQMPFNDHLPVHPTWTPTEPIRFDSGSYNAQPRDNSAIFGHYQGVYAGGNEDASAHAMLDDRWMSLMHDYGLMAYASGPPYGNK